MSLIRRLVSLGLVALAAAAVMPVGASAATPATLRLMGSEPTLGHQVTITTPDGSTITGEPGFFRLRVTPAGQAPVEYRGFCADLDHHIDEGTDYAVSLKTAVDDATLASARSSEAAWLLGQADAFVAAASNKGLEAGALQVAVWQLTDQARETKPSSDAAVNARAAALRALASGRALGGPLTATPAMPRGCAGRSAVSIALTGTPGSTADLSITAGAGALSATSMRFPASGRATVSVSSAVSGSVTVTARSEGGTLTRIARARSTQSTPQETIVLTNPRSHTATATVTFENCPLIPSGGDTNPTPPTNTPSETPTGTSPDTPVRPFEAPGTPTTPAIPTAPRRPPQITRPRLSLSKTGPKTALAGSVVGYVIRVRNTGTVPVTDVAVTDALPAGMSLAGMPGGARLRSGRVVWTIPTLAPGATRTLRIGVRLNADVSGRRCNRASAAGTGSPTSSPATPRATGSSGTMVTAVRRPVAPAVTA
ncbi:MAG TPA: hypothetical protein PKD59_12735 [Miltoncostaeaceae bacterium]|nr:hypothetical protein [Miltoncostaeaceae bacterium]